MIYNFQVYCMDPDYVENALEDADVLLRVEPPPCQRVCDHELFWDAGCTDAAAPAHTPSDPGARDIRAHYI